MTPHIPEEFSTRLIDWSPFVIMGNTMPQRVRTRLRTRPRLQHRVDYPRSAPLAVARGPPIRRRTWHASTEVPSRFALREPMKTLQRRSS
jgi:hypothetical protein